MSSRNFEISCMKKQFLVLILCCFALFSKAIDKGDICVQAGVYNPVMYRYYQQKSLGQGQNWKIVFAIASLGMYPPSSTVNAYYTFNSYFSLGASFGVGGFKSVLEISSTANAYLHILQPIFDKKKSDDGDIADLYLLTFAGIDYYKSKVVQYDSTYTYKELAEKKKTVNWGVGIGYKVQIAETGLYNFGEFGKLEMSYMKIGIGYKFNYKQKHSRNKNTKGIL